ncbi:hypothetical protein HYX11_01220 [Candidatus Woesearchaeota archaeon]|nr:hypothetical protein [Candidatus Woesearchaeota archaeon]
MPKSIISNVNQERAHRLLDIIRSTTNHKVSDEHIIIVERNPHYLSLVIEQDILSLFSIPLATKKIVHAPNYVSDNLDLSGLIEEYGDFSIHQTSPIINIVGRTKGVESIIEKITRFLANVEYSGIHHPTQLHRIAVSDIYALNIVTSTQESCYAAKNALLSHPRFRLIEEKDYVTTPKESGYKAVHHYLSWNSIIPQLNDLHLEIHYETLEDHIRNKQGDVAHPERSHIIYSQQKLRKKHHNGGYKIFVFDHPLPPEQIFPQQWICTRTKLSPLIAGAAYYYLLKPIANGDYKITSPR